MKFKYFLSASFLILFIFLFSNNRYFLQCEGGNCKFWNENKIVKYERIIFSGAVKKIFVQNREYKESRISPKEDAHDGIHNRNHEICDLAIIDSKNEVKIFETLASGEALCSFKNDLEALNQKIARQEKSQILRLPFVIQSIYYVIAIIIVLILLLFMRFAKRKP